VLFGIGQDSWRYSGMNAAAPSLSIIAKSEAYGQVNVHEHMNTLRIVWLAGDGEGGEGFYSGGT
jgi:hypothetical protein